MEFFTDGGTENHNKTIDNLIIEQKDPRLNKVIAKKDVSFSNSPIEALNKVVKKYLRYHQPDTLEALQKLVPINSKGLYGSSSWFFKRTLTKRTLSKLRFH